MSVQRDQLTKLCPPGSDPIEAWALRLSRSDLNLTAKVIGHHIGWHALMCGTELRWAHSYWNAANLVEGRLHDNNRAVKALQDLERLGFIKLICSRDLPERHRTEWADNTIVGFRVIVGGGP